MINFVVGANTVKFIFRDFVELHCLDAFLVVATVDYGFQELQWLGNSVVGLFHTATASHYAAVCVAMDPRVLCRYVSCVLHLQRVFSI